jgi:acetyltransferase
LAGSRDLGFSHFVSLGNKADLDETDWAQHWAGEDNTQVICAYLEGIKRGVEFMRTAQTLTKLKPFIIIKAGRSVAGAKAATSHTGTLAGASQDSVFEAAFRQIGVIRAETLQELLGFASTFSSQPLPTNDAVAVVSNAGGPGIMAADAIERAGLRLARLSPETLQELRRALPKAASTLNPVDVLGDAQASRFGAAIDAVLRDPAVGSLVLILTPQATTESEGTAELLCDLSAKYGKPCVASFMGSDSVKNAVQVLSRNKLTNFVEPEDAVGAIKALVSHAVWRATPAQELEKLPGIDVNKARNVLTQVREAGHLATGGFEAREVLAAYGVPQPRSILAENADQAEQAARDFGFPSVLKVASPDILHKSKVGGVLLNLKGPQQVRDAFELIVHRAKTKCPDALLRGVQVLPMIKEVGRETIVGISRDPTFGPLIMFGLGGSFVEGIRDVTFRVAPIDRREAREMIEEIRFLNFLKRAPGVDLEAIEDVLLRVSQLAVDFPEIDELDINPLLVFPPGKGALSLDMRLSLIP